MASNGLSSTYRYAVHDEGRTLGQDLDIVLGLVLAHAVVHRVDSLPASHLLNPLHHVLLLIIDHKLGPVRFRQLHFLRRARRANDPNARRLQELTQSQIDAARDRVDQHSIALLDRIDLLGQRQSRETLYYR